MNSQNIHANEVDMHHFLSFKYDPNINKEQVNNELIIFDNNKNDTNGHIVKEESKDSFHLNNYNSTHINNQNHILANMEEKILPQENKDPCNKSIGELNNLKETNKLLEKKTGEDDTYNTFDKSKSDTKESRLSIEIDENSTLFSLFQGFLFMFLSCVFKSIFSLLSKYAMNKIPNLSSFQLLTFRTYMMLFISILSSLFIKVHIFSEEFIKADKIFHVFLRTIFSIASMSLVIYCVKHIYVSDVYSIYYIYPAFLIILSKIFLKEKIRVFDYICLLACFTGAILIVKPEFIFNSMALPNDNKNTAYNYNNTYSLNNNFIYNNNTVLEINENSIINLVNPNVDDKNFSNKEGINPFYIILVLIAALLKAIEDFIVKDIGKAAHFLAFPIMYTLLGIIIFPIPMFINDTVYPKFTKFDVFIFFLIAVCTFLYISFLALGFQTENAGRVSMVNYFQIIFMYLGDLTFFHKNLELLDLIGTIVIFGFNFTNGILKTIKRKEQLLKYQNNYKNVL